VGSCDVLLVIIGKKWLTCADASGNRRLDDPKDFIRLETATALRGISGSFRCWSRTQTCRVKVICPMT